MAILFPAKAVKYAPGQIILVVAGTSVTFATAEFVANLTQATSIPAVWDWGDGTVEAVTTASVAHVYASPGIYPLVLQTTIAGAVQTGSWRVRVLFAAANLSSTATPTIPWVAAAQSTFVLEDGSLRHAIIPLPGLSAVQSGTYIGTWGEPGAVNLSSGLAKATDEAATRWQHAYATGFGRIPAPESSLEQGVWGHFAMDAVAFGTIAKTGKILAGEFATLESAWRELQRDSTDGHRAVTLASALSAVASFSRTDLDVFERMDMSPTTYLDSGDSSVAMADVMRWLEYVNREADDRTSLADLQVARWRRTSGAFVPEPPTFHAATAWAWEVAQAAMQTVHAFYFSFNGATTEPNVANAKILVLADPRTGQASLRVFDDVAKLWFEVLAGPVAGPQASPEIRDLATERGTGWTGWIGARAVAAGTTEASSLYDTFDVRRLELLLDPELRRQTPTLGALTTTSDPDQMTRQTGLSTTVALVQDGAVRRSFELPVGAANRYYVDVVRPAERADKYDGLRGGLRPHAEFAVRNGRSYLPAAKQGAGSSISSANLSLGSRLGSKAK